MDGFGLLAASEALGLALARRPLFYYIDSTSAVVKRHRIGSAVGVI